MDKFYFGMKVRNGDEIGLVIKPEVNSDWDKEPLLILWDTAKENDIEDWRGLYKSFIDSGGMEISSDTEFRFITEEGELKK